MAPHKMHIYRWFGQAILYVGLSALLMACIVVKPKLEGRRMVLTRHISYDIQGYQAWPTQLQSWQQEIIIQSPSDQQTLIASLEISKSGATLVFLTPLGQTLLLIRDDGVNVHREGPLVDKLPIDAAWLLALVQLAIFEQSDVRHGLSHDPKLVFKDVPFSQEARAKFIPWPSALREISFDQVPEIQINCCDERGVLTMMLPKQTKISMRILPD